MNALLKIPNNFQINGKTVECFRYGNGHINDTYLVKTDKGSKYIFQRINHLVFKNVDMLMKNQELVTSYISRKLQSQGAYNRRLLLNLVYTLDNESYLIHDGNYYRCYEFIEGGQCLEKIEHPYQFELAGTAFGRFQRLLDGFEADKLYEVIPDFHNTVSRYNQLLSAINDDKAKRAQSCRELTEKFLSRKDYCDKVIKEIDAGNIPVRVTHNDTKLNNALIDMESKEALAVLDLDTVMPGSILYDFGDSIRYGANTGAEDEKDLTKVGFDMELYKAFAKGFINQVKDILTQGEIRLMAFSSILMTYECGMRFLTDHLNGDVYFKISREEHNLDRAKTQMKMVENMEKSIDQMQEYIWSFYEKSSS